MKTSKHTHVYTNAHMYNTIHTMLTIKPLPEQTRNTNQTFPILMHSPQTTSHAKKTPTKFPRSSPN